MPARSAQHSPGRAAGAEHPPRPPGCRRAAGATHARGRGLLLYLGRWRLDAEGGAAGGLRAPAAGAAHGGRGPAARSDPRAAGSQGGAGAAGARCASPRATGKHCGEARTHAAPARPGTRALLRAVRASETRPRAPDRPRSSRGCPRGARRSGRAATSGQDEAHTPAGATGHSGAGGWSSPRDSIASAVPGLVLRSGTSDSQGSVLTGLAACAVTKVNEHLFSAHCVPRLLRLPAPGRLLGVQSVQWHRPCAQKGLTLGLTPCCPTLEILSDF